MYEYFYKNKCMNIFILKHNFIEIFFLFKYKKKNTIKC